MATWLTRCSCSPTRNSPPPDKNDPKVRVYEAGRIHDAGEILLGDGETLYLEGGAVVRGEVRARNARNVAVRGAGILDAGPANAKSTCSCCASAATPWSRTSSCSIRSAGRCTSAPRENVRLSNTRVVGWRANSDGLDIEYSGKVRVDGCFWRTNDDCIAVKAIYPPGVKASRSRK